MNSNSVQELTQSYLETIEHELQVAVKRANFPEDTRLYEMLVYHMGWASNSNSKTVRGKRIRPLLVLLSCASTGGDWREALPAASAVELVHNFSLIHDDIEDHSPLRHGRPTVWKKWGIPQAINTGDAMFALAHLEAVRLAETVSPAVAMRAVELLQFTCLRLTQGQFLDLAYEAKPDLTTEDYWQMVEGKTAALVSACTELGAMAAFSNDDLVDLFRKFGRSLGLAFQVQDDFLGIWGNSDLTGKSSQSDLLSKKITLPVLYGLSLGGGFASRWNEGQIQRDELQEILRLLEVEGVKSFTEAQATHHINEALAILDETHPGGIAGEALKDLARSLVNRQV